VPFSQTEVGSGSLITPNYASETFSVVTGGNYRVSWILNVASFTPPNFSLGLRINGTVNALTVVTVSSVGEVRGEADLALAPGDVVQLFHASVATPFAPVAPSGGPSLTLSASPAIGAAISFVAID
jgi:hypothetical protein